MTSELHVTSTSRHRFHVLDGLRGVAAVLVVFWHMPLALDLRALVQRPYLAVDFFFCLSGFVIGFAYERRLERDLRISDFAILRLVRLYPLYFLATLLGFIELLSHGFPFQDLGFAKLRVLLLTVTGFLMVPTHGKPFGALYPLDFPAWSLFYELSANLAFAVLVRRGRASNTFLLLASVASFSMLVLWACKGGLLGAIGWESTLQPFLMGFPRVIVSFCLGIFVLRAYRRQELLGKSTGRWSLAIALAATLLLILILVAPLPFMHTEPFNLFVITCVFPMIVYFGASCRLPRAFHPVCNFLGESSYPLYLLHVVVMQLLFTNVFIHFQSGHYQAARVMALGLILMTAWVSYLLSRIYDSPIRAAVLRAHNTWSSGRQNSHPKAFQHLQQHGD